MPFVEGVQAVWQFLESTLFINIFIYFISFIPELIWRNIQTIIFDFLRLNRNLKFIIK